VSNPVPSNVVSHNTIQVEPEKSAVNLYHRVYKDIVNTPNSSTMKIISYLI